MVGCDAASLNLWGWDPEVLGVQPGLLVLGRMWGDDGPQLAEASGAWHCTCPTCSEGNFLLIPGENDGTASRRGEWKKGSNSGL